MMSQTFPEIKDSPFSSSGCPWQYLVLYFFLASPFTLNLLMEMCLTHVLFSFLSFLFSIAAFQKIFFASEKLRNEKQRATFGEHYSSPSSWLQAKFEFINWLLCQ